MLKNGELATIEVPKMLVQNIGKIGTLQCIEHYADSEVCFYRTMLVGSQGVLRICGGYSSGYQGEGSRGFYDFLLSLGLLPGYARGVAFTPYSCSETRGMQKRIIQLEAFPNMDTVSLVRAANALTLKSPYSYYQTPLDCAIHVKIPKGSYEIVYYPRDDSYVLDMQQSGVVKLTKKNQRDTATLLDLTEQGVPKYVVQFLEQHINKGLLTYMRMLYLKTES